MALAVLATGVLRATLPSDLRAHDSRWLLLVIVGVLLLVLIVGDPGRIDRQRRWLRVLTDLLIAAITLANAVSTVLLVGHIINGTGPFDSAGVLLASGGAIWLTNVIAFSLWYWDLDRGGAAERAHTSRVSPAFIFPEMNLSQFAGDDWTPAYLDYLHLSFTTATAFSPTDASAIRPWAKLMMMAEEALSLVVAIVVVGRAVNIMK
jgi:hypothetical protein